MTDDLEQLHAGGAHAPVPVASVRRLGLRMGLAIIAVLASSIQQSALAAPSASFSGYRYTHMQSLDATVTEDNCIYLQHKEVERWVAADGSGFERRVEEDQPEFLSEEGRSHCAPVLARIGPIGGTHEIRYGPSCMSVSGAPVDLSRLPTEPSRLRELLETGKIEGGPLGPVEAFTQIGDLLRNSDASPELRSALYEVASELSGVQSTGEVTDPAGRLGVGLAMVDRHIREELIFDPQTSVLIAERNTIADNRVSGAPVGAVFGEAVYWPSAIVDTPLPSVPRTAKMTLCEPRPATPPAVVARRAHRSHKTRRHYRPSRSHGTSHRSPRHGRPHRAGAGHRQA